MQPAWGPYVFVENLAPLAVDPSGWRKVPKPKPPSNLTDEEREAFATIYGVECKSRDGSIPEDIDGDVLTDCCQAICLYMVEHCRSAANAGACATGCEQAKFGFYKEHPDGHLTIGLLMVLSLNPNLIKPENWDLFVDPQKQCELLLTGFCAAKIGLLMLLYEKELRDRE